MCQTAYTALAFKDPASRDYRVTLGQLFAAVRRWDVCSCCGKAIRTCMSRAATCLHGSCQRNLASGSV